MVDVVDVVVVYVEKVVGVGPQGIGVLLVREIHTNHICQGKSVLTC